MLLLVLAAGALAMPEQVHIAFNNAESFWVSWLDADDSTLKNNQVKLEGVQRVTTAQVQRYQYQSRYGTDPVYTSPLIFHAAVWGIKCNTQYTYQVGGPDAWSLPFSTTTPPCLGKDVPVVLGMVGDLGQTVNSSITIDDMAATIGQPGGIHLTWLIGDLCYADAQKGLEHCKYPEIGCKPERWDSWGRMVEKLASRVPLMVLPGNHEQEDNPMPLVGQSYIAYSSRMKPPAGGSTWMGGSYWWAMRTGGVHMISLNSYMPFNKGSDQYNWLVEELNRVDRAVTPWLFVGLHSPWYNSNHHHHNETEEWQMKLAMEPLLHEAKVDILFCGHVHTYERIKPVYNNVVTPGAMTELNIGDGGNRGVYPAGTDVWMNPQPEWSAFRKNRHGWGKLYVHNSTHAQWSWHTVDTPTLTDSLWFVKDPAGRGVIATQLVGEI